MEQKIVLPSVQQQQAAYFKKASGNQAAERPETRLQGDITMA
jgi:hypothetical protein